MGIIKTKRQRGRSKFVYAVFPYLLGKFTSLLFLFNRNGDFREQAAYFRGGSLPFRRPSGSGLCCFVVTIAKNSHFLNASYIMRDFISSLAHDK